MPTKKPQYTSTRKIAAFDPTLDKYTGQQVAPTMGGTTNFGQLATDAGNTWQGDQGVYLPNGTKGAAGTQTEVDDKGQTWQYIDHGDGTGEWKMTKDAAGMPVGDAKAIAERKAGTSIAGNGNAAPYNPNPAKQVLAQKQEDDILQQILNNAKGNQQENRQFIDDNVMPALNQQRGAADAADAMAWSGLDQSAKARDALKGKNAGLSAEQRGKAAGANAESRQMFTDYSGKQDALNAQDQGNLSRYMGETDPLMRQLTAQGSDPADQARQLQTFGQLQGVGSGSLDYNAQQYQSNSGDVSRQQQGYNRLTGIADGSLNYGADTYKSNAGDVARQEADHNALSGAGMGSLNYSSDAADAYADNGDVAKQRGYLGSIEDDLNHGDADQRDMFNLAVGRTGVGATAEETLLAELARRKFESDDTARRGAVMEDQSQRGLRSGAAEIANMVSGQQQTSQDRTLAEMGLNANAVARAQGYTQMASDQANQMRGNTQNALGMGANLSTAIRNASFDEAYKRGSAGDQAKRDNQSTQLSGMAGAASTANTMRGQSDQVGTFNSGQINNARANNQATQFGGAQAASNTANTMRGQSDQVGTFNAGQVNNAQANNQSTRLSGVQGAAVQSNAIRSANDSMRMFQDTYASNEATRVGNLANDRAQTGLATTGQVGARNTSTYNDGAQMVEGNYGRDKDSISLDIGNALTDYAADQDVAGDTRSAGADAYQRRAGITGSATGVAGTRAGITQTDDQRLLDALQLGLGVNSKNQGLASLGGR